MRIADVLEKMKKFLEPTKHLIKLQFDEKGYWVDVFTDSMSLGDLSNLTHKMAEQFGMDASRFMIWAAKEDEVGIGFFLPYLRSLRGDEVRAKYIYIESESRNYFPPQGKKFVIVSNGKRYEVSLDVHDRVFLAEWFNDNPLVKQGDTISIWCLTEGEEYLLKVLKNDHPR